jgi:hypothetical protein
MAKVQTGDYIAVWQKKVICSHPTTPLTGNLCRVGDETGIALTSEATTDTGLTGNLTGYTTVMVGPFRAKVPVKGANEAGNIAVSDGDRLYYVDADVNDGTGFLSRKRSGYFFGFARAAVVSGSTTSIEVDHIPSGHSGGLNLSATQQVGYIPLSLSRARIIASNDIAAKGTPDGGTVSLDTDPTFKRVNGATDKQLRIAWAASSVIPITWDFVLPPDLDIYTTVLTVNLIMSMASTNDTPTVAVNYFNNAVGSAYSGDTNAGGNTAAITGATPTKYTKTIAVADLVVAGSTAIVELVPGTHGTDALYLWGAYISYNKL